MTLPLGANVTFTTPLPVGPKDLLQPFAVTAALLSAAVAATGLNPLPPPLGSAVLELAGKVGASIADAVGCAVGAGGAVTGGAATVVATVVTMVTDVSAVVAADVAVTAGGGGVVTDSAVAVTGGAVAASDGGC